MENMEVMKHLVNTYSGKKVFVTGHTGFKGSWLLAVLNKLGAVVKGYALAPEQELNLFDEINGSEICDSVIADIRNKEKLEDAILSFSPDFIFHLAAQPLVRRSYQIPVETFEVNVIGTANLLDAVRKMQNKCSVVLITTDKVYHNLEKEHAYQEIDRLGGYDPYSSSKACCELLIDSYRNSFFNISNISSHLKGIAVARAGNVIGGGDWSEDRIIPDIVRSLISSKEILIRNPNSVRPWQHVIEPVFGYLQLATKLQEFPELFSQAYNFGPNPTDTFTVKEIVERSISKWGSGSHKIQKSDSSPHEANILMLDISKVRDQLKWKPVFNAEFAIELTVNWYKHYYSRTKALDLINRDISFYNNLL